MTPAEVREFRRSLGLSTAAFARAVGVSDGRLIRRWEAGDYTPHGSLQVIAELAQAIPAVRRALIARASPPDRATDPDSSDRE